MIPTNIQDNISKICLEEGKWDNYTNYTDCLDHPLDGGRGGAVEEWGVFIFLLGYTVSIITLLLAIFIFLYFREMRCLRHKIHLNLFLSLLTANMDWVLSYGVQVSSHIVRIFSGVTFFLLKKAEKAKQAGAELQTRKKW